LYQFVSCVVLLTARLAAASLWHLLVWLNKIKEKLEAERCRGRGFTEDLPNRSHISLALAV
jgi:hypothetical protein